MMLPEDNFVFCSFNHNYKITTEEFDIWIEALIPNTYVVDLSGDGIFRHNGSSIDAMSRAEINSVVDSVPQLPRQRLQRFLQTVTESTSLSDAHDNEISDSSSILP